MTHEERAVWIKRGIIAFLAVVVVVGVLLYPEKKPEEAAKPPKKEEKKHYELEILHFHQPGNAESEQVATSLKEIERIFEDRVLVTRIDVNKEPERAKAEKVTAPPKVVMMSGQTRACKFQGVWTEKQIETKVEQILSGLKTPDEDWRPQGMQRATESNAPKLSSPPPPAAAPTTTTKR